MVRSTSPATTERELELELDIAEFLADEPSRSGEPLLERIAITYFAIPNANTRAGGFLPVYQINDGRVHGDEYGPGYDLEVAQELARQRAEEEAAHYVGDWDVTVRPSKTKGARPASSTPAFSPLVDDRARRRSRARSNRPQRRRRRASEQRLPSRPLHSGRKGASQR
jgi:hypothetical protein